MRFYYPLLAFALLFLFFSSLNAAPSMKIKESIVTPSAEWIDEGRASPNDLLSFTIAVKQTNVDKLEKVLLEVSDPSSPVYGQHLSKEEIDEMIAPSPSSLFAIIDWLKSNQIPLANVKTTGNSDFIQIPLTVAQFEKLLHTKVHVFSHRQKKHHRIKRVKKHYSLPEHLHAHIDFISPTVRFPKTFGPVAVPVDKPRPQLSASPNDVCSSGVSPDCLRAIYQIPTNQTAKSTTAVACMGFLEQYVSFSDLSSFYSQYQTSLSGYQPTIIGPNVQTSPGVEAMLDIEYLSALANGASATFWYVAGRQPNSTAENEPFLDWLTALASTSNPPLIFSTSYGDNENTVNQDYAYRVNIEFIKGGARGISFLFSSGDGGVAGGQSSSCTTFIPTFPAGSPYVTAVGGTTSYPEQAASFSSGGFANYFGRAPYQKQAVNDYLNKYGTNLPSSSLYNATGRGFPDVSAQSTYFPVVCGGFTQPVQGTSCSSPAFSGIVGLLNDIRFSLGKSSLGFLNPLFYEHPEVFNDITQGNNPGCNTNGFYASQGWDPITGLGTPNFPKLVALVESLP